MNDSGSPAGVDYVGSAWFRWGLTLLGALAIACVLYQLLGDLSRGEWTVKPNHRSPMTYHYRWSSEEARPVIVVQLIEYIGLLMSGVGMMIIAWVRRSVVWGATGLGLSLGGALIFSVASLLLPMVRVFFAG